MAKPKSHNQPSKAAKNKKASKNQDKQTKGSTKDPKGAKATRHDKQTP